MVEPPNGNARLYQLDLELVRRAARLDDSVVPTVTGCFPGWLRRGTVSRPPSPCRRSLVTALWWVGSLIPPDLLVWSHCVLLRPDKA